MTEFNRFGIKTAAVLISNDHRSESGRELSLAAKLIASQPPVPAYSQIVLAGIVRLALFGIISVVGTGIYLGYVFPEYGFEW
jgi:hypothetical protein